MKIAITADLHLAIKEDYPERYNALENILGQIENENIESLLIVGDLFDRDFHSYAGFESLCKKHPQIQIHIIPGNHDAGISGESIVGPNIHIYTAPTSVVLGSTTFLFVPYKEKTKMGEQIASLEQEIRGKDWILVGHGDYYGGTKELNPLEPGTYMPLSRENVLTFNPRAVFLGISSNWTLNAQSRSANATYSSPILPRNRPIMLKCQGENTIRYSSLSCKRSLCMKTELSTSIEVDPSSWALNPMPMSDAG